MSAVGRSVWAAFYCRVSIRYGVCEQEEYFDTQGRKAVIFSEGAGRNTIIYDHNSCIIIDLLLCVPTPFALAQTVSVYVGHLERTEYSSLQAY